MESDGFLEAKIGSCFVFSSVNFVVIGSESGDG